MAFIGRIFVIFFAFLLASMAAGITIAFGWLASEWQLLQSDPVARGGFWVASFFGANAHKRNSPSLGSGCSTH